MSWLSSDADFEQFLRRVPLSVGWRERPVIPRRAVLAEAYQRETDLLVDALRSGSQVRLAIAVAGMGPHD